MPDMRLTSPAFNDGESIPETCTCEGINHNPALEFHDVPGQAKSLALVLEDPDAPHGTFIHWTIWNLGPRLAGIQEDQEPREAVVGKNSWGHNRYGGPCPPMGTHHYEFRLYALDSRLDISGNSNRDQLVDAMEGHILAVAKLVGLYGKKGE